MQTYRSSGILKSVDQELRRVMSGMPDPDILAPPFAAYRCSNLLTAPMPDSQDRVVRQEIHLSVCLMG
jgi:hypothetical protein